MIDEFGDCALPSSPIRKVDGEYRLTEQGNAHAQQLTAQLASQARIEDRR